MANPAPPPCLRPRSPDGGWGWVVVLSSFLLQLLTIGITYTFGILLTELVNEFNVDMSTAAWIGSIQPCLLYFTGLASGAMVERFGWRIVTMLGSVISAGGFLASSFTTDIYLLYVTYGVLTGIGNGLMYVTSMVTVQHYFEKKRAMATGIAVSGSGMGTLVFGFLVEFLISNFGWRNALRIEAGIMLLGVICGAVFRPLENKKPKKKRSRTLDHVCSDSEAPPPYTEIDVIEGPTTKCCGFIDFAMFKKPVFLLFCMTMFLFCFGYHVPYTYTPDRATALGVPRNKAAFLVSIIGISNVAGRLLFGWLGDINVNCRFWLGGTMCLLGGASSCCVHWCNTYDTMVVYCVLFGVFSGCWVSLFPVVLVDLLGVDSIETSLGQVFAFSSMAFLIASPLSGFIIDTTGLYEAPYWVVGGAEMLGALFYFCCRCFTPQVPPGYNAFAVPVGAAPGRTRTESVRRSFMTESFS